MSESSGGFVYILSNPDFSYLKIGMTTRDPRDRCKDLSQTSSLPHEFQLEYARFHRNPFALESAVHQVLNEYRVREQREFFSLPLEDAISAVQQTEVESTTFVHGWYTRSELAEKLGVNTRTIHRRVASGKIDKIVTRDNVYLYRPADNDEAWDSIYLPQSLIDQIQKEADDEGVSIHSLFNRIVGHDH